MPSSMRQHIKSAFDGLRSSVRELYARLLEREISRTPAHIAVIQDGNRRYARERGKDTSAGHRAGAETAQKLLEWCDDFDIEELTLYAFSTENFDRPDAEREALFDLIADRLYELADDDAVHDREVRVRAIGQIHRLPDRVRDAIAYADGQTEGYDRLQLNVALAYGGRAQLRDVAREMAREAVDGELDPTSIDVEAVETRLMAEPTQPVDLIIRTGGEERTSNFLPWHASGNEAAVYFCAPYWPEFSRAHLLRAIRTYEAREQSWRRTRIERWRALAGALADSKPAVATRLREQIERDRTISDSGTDTDIMDDDTVCSADLPADE